MNALAVANSLPSRRPDRVSAVEVLSIASHYKSYTRLLSNGRARLPAKRRVDSAPTSRKNPKLSHNSPLPQPPRPQPISKSTASPRSHHSNASAENARRVVLKVKSQPTKDEPRKSRRMVSGKESQMQIDREEEEKERKKARKVKKEPKKDTKKEPKLSSRGVSKSVKAKVTKPKPMIRSVPAAPKQSPSVPSPQLPTPSSHIRLRSERPRSAHHSQSPTRPPSTPASTPSIKPKAPYISPSTRTRHRSEPRVASASNSPGKRSLPSTPASTPSNRVKTPDNVSPNSRIKLRSERPEAVRARAASTSNSPTGKERIKLPPSRVSSASPATSGNSPLRAPSASLEEIQAKIRSLETDFRATVARAFELKQKKKYESYVAETRAAVRISFQLGLAKESELRFNWNGLSASVQTSRKREVIQHYRRHSLPYVQSRLEELAEIGQKEKASWYRRAIHKVYLRIYVLHRLGTTSLKKRQKDMGNKLLGHLNAMEKNNEKTANITIHDLKYLKETVQEYGNLLTLIDAAILDNTEGVEEAGSEMYIP